MNKGLASVLPGTPRLVKAVDPKIGLKALLNQKNREWQNRSAELQNIINRLEKKTQDKQNLLNQR